MYGWEPMIVDCIFIIQKGDEYNNQNQILAFVDDRFIDANCHPPTNCIHYKKSQYFLIKKLVKKTSP
jgi:hypothetical protein